MKTKSQYLLFLVLFFGAVSIFIAACPKPGPVEGTPLNNGEAGEPPKVITPEQYWQIQLERQRATLLLYQQMLEVYKKYGCNTQSQPEIANLQKKHNERMREILTAHGLESGAEIFPSGPDRPRILQERNQYIQDHPEIKDEFMKLSMEIKAAKDEIESILANCK